MGQNCFSLLSSSALAVDTSFAHLLQFLQILQITFSFNILWITINWWQPGHHCFDSCKGVFLTVFSSFREITPTLKTVGFLIFDNKQRLYGEKETTSLPSRFGETFLTVIKSRVNQVLGTFQHDLPVLAHHLLYPIPCSKAEVLYPPVVEGGPAAAVGKDEADKEDCKVDREGGHCPKPPPHWA